MENGRIVKLDITLVLETKSTGASPVMPTIWIEHSYKQKEVRILPRILTVSLQGDNGVNNWEICFSSEVGFRLVLALRNFVVNFQTQFRLCHDQGFHKKTIRKRITPKLLPFCPCKRRDMLRSIIKNNITHFDFTMCGRFGGTCRSKHPKCVQLRKQFSWQSNKPLT